MVLYVFTAYISLVIMSITNPICRRCSAELNDENWYGSSKKRRDYICKPCLMDRNKKWYHANLNTARAQKTRANRKHGMKPMIENKECASFLGVHVAEKVLYNVFKNVKRMPHNHPGYDFICGNGYKIDVKSSTTRKEKSWEFNIRQNMIADYFLCIAFDNRDDLNPLYLWLIPKDVANKSKIIYINKNTIAKWNTYKLDMNRVIKCCNTLKKK